LCPGVLYDAAGAAKAIWARKIQLTSSPLIRISGRKAVQKRMRFFTRQRFPGRVRIILPSVEGSG
jgi:hypothetical protein